MQKVRKFFGYIGAIVRLTIMGFSLSCLLGILFLLSGGYAAAVADRDSHIVVEIAKDPNIQNVASRLGSEDYRQINCLAQNMYFEAGNQGQVGMAAVGDVVFNRMKSGLFPDRICQVIDQGTIVNGKKVTTGCQFSWRCVPGTYVIRNRDVYATAYNIAYNQYLYREKMPSVVGTAKYYHADYVDPHNGIWKTACPTAKIGAHIFYALHCSDRTATGEREPFVRKGKVDKRVAFR